MGQEQNSEVRQSKWNSVWTIFLTVVITIAVVVGGMYLWKSITTVPKQETSKVFKTQSVQTRSTLEGEIVTEEENITTSTKLVNTAISGISIEKSYNFNHGEPEGFTSLSKGNTIFMQKKAMAKLYENEENITSFYTPEHPTNKNIIFISTNGDMTGKMPNIKSTNRIYSYNIKTGKITELYKEHKNRFLRTVGMDGSKLVLMYDIIDSSLGPCFSIWVNWKSFGYLELADISSGLHPYTVPNYQVEKGRIEQEKCVEENFKVNTISDNSI
jgi:flagellar basal body rod protein FlgC